MGFWSSFGSSALEGSTSGLMSNLGMVDYEINPLARAGYEDFWNDSRSNAFEWSQKGAALEYDYFKRSLRDSPSLQKQGLIAAGYNPILAVNSSAGAPFKTSLSDVQAGSLMGSSARGSGIMENMAKEALIKQTQAQTKFIERKTDGEGWQVKTLTRSEAMGLGANLVRTLGFNFHDSSQQTFLVAYNPITGELRNLGDTKTGLGTTGETTNAGQVDVELDGKRDSSHYYDDSSDHPYKSVKLNPYNFRGE